MGQRTKMGIINMALVGLGAAAVSALPPDETTNQGLMADAIWDMSLEEVLRAHPWNFAVTRAALPRLTAPPAFGYSAAYNLPADCLRVLEVSDPDYTLESGQILCNDSGPLQLRYIRRIDDVTRFDAAFAATLAARLMVRLAYPITQSASQQQTQIALYEQQLKAARNIDAQEQPSEEFEESVLISGRF